MLDQLLPKEDLNKKLKSCQQCNYCFILAIEDYWWLLTGVIIRHGDGRSGDISVTVAGAREPSSLLLESLSCDALKRTYYENSSISISFQKNGRISLFWNFRHLVDLLNFSCFISRGSMASKMWHCRWGPSANLHLFRSAKETRRNRREEIGMGQIQFHKKTTKRCVAPSFFGGQIFFFYLLLLRSVAPFWGKWLRKFVTGSLTRSTWDFSRQLSRQECLRDSNGWFPRVGSGTSLPSLKVELIWGLNVCTWILQHEMLRLFWGQRNFGWRIFLQCKKDILKYRIIGWSIPVVNCYEDEHIFWYFL